MTNAKNKTVATEASVDEFISAVSDTQKRADSLELIKIMHGITKQPPVMWGSSMVGFGQIHYKSPSGREGDWLATGFSPRKNALTLYLTYGIDQYQDYLDKLGPHKTGKGCLYIKRLSDVDMSVLKELINTAYKDMTKN